MFVRFLRRVPDEAAAYRAALAIPRAQLVELFPDDPPDPHDPPITDVGRRRLAQQLHDEELAAWCIVTGQSPATYLDLTNDQRDAFLRVARRGRR